MTISRNVLLVLVALSSYTHLCARASPDLCLSSNLPGKREDISLFVSSSEDRYLPISAAVEDGQTYAVGDSFEYRCRGDYILKGPRKVECKKNNTLADWEPKNEEGIKRKNPYCEPACPYFPFTHPHAFTFTEWESDSSWETIRSTIPFNSCHKAENEEHMLECNEMDMVKLVSVGTIAYFDCHDGYKPNETRIAACVEMEGKAEWTTSESWKCLAQCREPNVEKNNVRIVRYRKESYTEGDIIQLDCKPDYVKNSGHETVRCEDSGKKSELLNFTGKWDHELLNCVAACKLDMSRHKGLKLVDLEPGMQESSDKGQILVFPKTKVHFDCQEGYKLVGEGSKTCGASGQWTGSGDLPTCEAQCEGFPQAENGNPTMVGVANDSKYHEQGQIIQYKCDDNFLFNKTSPTFVRCEKAMDLSSEPMWSGSIECEPACQVWFDIHNGGFNFSDKDLKKGSALVPLGTTVKFFCKEGFELEGANVTTCGKDHKWTPNHAPYCQKQCPAPAKSLLAHPDQKNLQTYYSPGDTVTYVCEEGAVKPPDATMQVNCSGDRDNVAFVGPLLRCEPTCGTPPVVRNAKIERIDQAGAEASRIQKSIIGTAVRYVCDSNFELRHKDHHSLKCLVSTGLNAIWAGHVPICDPTCANPTSNRTQVEIDRRLCLGNGRCRLEAEVKIHCKSGFYAPKTGMVKCEATGASEAVWSPRLPHCVPMSSYKELTNAVHTNKSVCNQEKYCIPGERVQLECPRGYAFEGGTPESWPLCNGTDHAASFAEEVPNCEEKFVEDRSEEIKRQKAEREREEKEQTQKDKMVLTIILSVSGLVIFGIILGLVIFVVVKVKRNQGDQSSGNQTEHTTVDADSVSGVQATETALSTVKESRRTGRDETQKTETAGSRRQSPSKRETGVTTLSMKKGGKPATRTSIYEDRIASYKINE